MNLYQPPLGSWAVDLDRTDIAILRCLQRDARLSLRLIAKEVGVSTPTVSARLTTLTQLGIVKGYAAVLDPERLNETTFVLLVKARPPSTDAVASAIAKLAGVRRVLVARGGRIVVDATVVDPRDVDAVLEKVAGLHDVVDVDHHVAIRALKEEPRAILADALTTSLVCYQCKGPIKGEPIKIRMDGRDHYLCCTSCEKLYVERHRKLKAAA